MVVTAGVWASWISYKDVFYSMPSRYLVEHVKLSVVIIDVRDIASKSG